MHEGRAAEMCKMNDKEAVESVNTPSSTSIQPRLHSHPRLQDTKKRKENFPSFLLSCKISSCVAVIPWQTRALWLFTCSLVDAISDELIEHLVERHDDMRRKLAYGTALNDNGTLPSAKNMYSMIFAGALGDEAEKLVRKCSSRVRSTKTPAQNIRFFKEENLTLMDDKELVDIALSEWYSPVQKYGLHSENNTYNDLQLESFANMIYYMNNNFGCALNRCNTSSTRTPLVAIIMCLYLNPPVFGEPLYESGTACANNSDCTPLSYSVCLNGLCTTHVIFTRPEPNDICPQNVNMTDNIRKSLQNMHNKYRSKLALGQVKTEQESLPTAGAKPRTFRGETDEPEGTLETSTTPELSQRSKSIQQEGLPTAGDMYYMMYDCDLEAGAQQHANECSLKISDSSSRKDVGENIYVSFGNSRYLQNAAENAVNAWWEEMPKKWSNKEMIFTEEIGNDMRNWSLLYFTQMVWARSFRLGCGVQKCAGYVFVVCRYSERGNTVGRHVYHIGSPCEFCTETCAARVGLCRPPSLS